MSSGGVAEVATEEAAQVRVEEGVAALATEEATQVRVEESSPAGGLPEPAQRLLAGPWERIRPALVT